MGGGGYMEDILQFPDRESFREWLSDHCRTSSGVWLLFGKADGPKTIKAGEALEEALCFGWIDGQMRRIDDTAYKKYFSSRRKTSKWSAKNRALAEALERQGRMTEAGLEKMAQARKDGRWDVPEPPAVTQEQIDDLSSLLVGFEPAHTNFLSMPLSVRKTYARAYFDAKTEAGREKRISWMIGRLNQNLKPM